MRRRMFFDGCRTERANQLILQIRDAHVEPEPFHCGAREVRAETGALERSPKDPLLARIVKACEPESIRWSTELGQEASDAVRTSKPNDLDAGRREVDPRRLASVSIAIWSLEPSTTTTVLISTSALLRICI